ncbi:MAG: class I SAM-dependent methyltransferase [Alphaproteobacteria bacterium CG_4_10_14_0_2_um_filter_63_37]|nr:MAG: SAM-dependent methyltransferase [Proteobacteria bacterium CG1_02_64_396]PJA25763.1 MAG: class I SAM-dependent methyltransferase [Alphaproteobacteria bacterium CG_4_10_14_0_2_um_filter_63_37]
MDPTVLGTKYDKIADWWRDRHDGSDYGLAQIEQALGFAPTGGKALDVGCGAGGRVIRLLQDRGFAVTGVDVSRAMVDLARAAHPEHRFFHHDIATWQNDEPFDLIVAWDSLFHLPLALHPRVLTQLCDWLRPQGVLIYTFGNASGEHTDRWHDDTFYYSSIGIRQNLELLWGRGLEVLHLELDQHPLNHVYAIAAKP